MSKDMELKKVAQIIKNGGIVVFPTETVYGIGTNGLDANAIKKLYEVKKRSLSKPISLLVSDIDMIKKVAKNITEAENKIIENFFPGPLTIILKKKKIVPDILTANGDTVGIRIPDNEIARKLIKYAGVPIATPSANISGKSSGINLQDIKKEFKNKVDYYVEDKQISTGVSSTIVKIEKGIPKILREGNITKKEIEKALKCVSK